jgi:hypothetical protein
MVTAVQTVIHVSERVMKVENSIPKQTLMIPLMMNIILQRKEKKRVGDYKTELRICSIILHVISSPRDQSAVCCLSSSSRYELKENSKHQEPASEQ